MQAPQFRVQVPESESRNPGIEIQDTGSTEDIPLAMER